MYLFICWLLACPGSDDRILTAKRQGLRPASASSGVKGAAEGLTFVHITYGVEILSRFVDAHLHKVPSRLHIQLLYHVHCLIQRDLSLTAIDTRKLMLTLRSFFESAHAAIADVQLALICGVQLVLLGFEELNRRKYWFTSVRSWTLSGVVDSVVQMVERRQTAQLLLE